MLLKAACVPTRVQSPKLALIFVSKVMCTRLTRVKVSQMMREQLGVIKSLEAEQAQVRMLKAVSLCHKMRDEWLRRREDTATVEACEGRLVTQRLVVSFVDVVQEIMTGGGMGPAKRAVDLSRKTVMQRAAVRHDRTVPLAVATQPFQHMVVPRSGRRKAAPTVGAPERQPGCILDRRRRGQATGAGAGWQAWCTGHDLRQSMTGSLQLVVNGACGWHAHWYFFEARRERSGFSNCIWRVSGLLEAKIVNS